MRSGDIGERRWGNSLGGSSVHGSAHSCYSLVGRLPEVDDVDGDSAPLSGRLEESIEAHTKSLAAYVPASPESKRELATDDLSPPVTNGARREATSDAFSRDPSTPVTTGARAIGVLEREILNANPSVFSRNQPPGSTENRSVVESGGEGGSGAPETSSVPPAPEFLMSGITRSLATEGPLVLARSGRRPQVREPVLPAASGPRKEKATTPDLVRPGMAPGRWHKSGCRNCGGEVPAPAPTPVKDNGAYCWLCGGGVTFSAQTQRCRSAALVCTSASALSSVLLVSGCSSSAGVVVSTPKEVPKNIQSEWSELQAQCSKLVGAGCRSQLAELSALLGVYFLAEASQPAASSDNAPAGGKRHARALELKEWSGVSSPEEFLVKNAVSVFVETPLDSPRNVRAVEVVCASWGHDSVVKTTHHELIGMGADLISSEISKDHARPAYGPRVVALANLSRLLHMGHVALVSRFDGDWGDLSPRGSGPSGHDLLNALLFGVHREHVDGATVLTVTKRRKSGGCRLTIGVFDKRSVTAGDLPRVLKKLKSAEH